MRAADISLVGRNTQGVRLMRLDEDEIVTSIERLADAEDDDTTSSDDSIGVPMAELEGDTVPVDMESALEDELEASEEEEEEEDEGDLEDQGEEEDAQEDED